MIYERYIGRGIVVGIVAVCYGLWLIWRGARNEVWMSNFGEPVIPRWIYIATGVVIAAGSIGYILFLRQGLNPK